MGGKVKRTEAHPMTCTPTKFTQSGRVSLSDIVGSYRYCYAYGIYAVLLQSEHFMLQGESDNTVTLGKLTHSPGEALLLQRQQAQRII